MFGFSRNRFSKKVKKEIWVNRQCIECKEVDNVTDQSPNYKCMNCLFAQSLKEDKINNPERYKIKEIKYGDIQCTICKNIDPSIKCICFAGYDGTHD